MAVCFHDVLHQHPTRGGMTKQPAPRRSLLTGAARRLTWVFYFYFFPGALVAWQSIPKPAAGAPCWECPHRDDCSPGLLTVKSQVLSPPRVCLCDHAMCACATVHYENVVLQVRNTKNIFLHLNQCWNCTVNVFNSFFLAKCKWPLHSYSTTET